MATKAIASECGADFYPMNSAVGFAHCLQLGVDGIEFDVHLTADDKVVVQHDYRLNKHITRDLDGNWLPSTGAALCQLTSNELSRYDVGRYQADSTEAKIYPEYRPVDATPIPHLAELIQLLADSGKTTELWVELKTTPYDRSTSSDPARLLDRVLEQIESSGLAAQTVLLAFEWDLLVLAKQRMPMVQTNFLTINTETVRRLNKRYGEVDLSELFGQFNPQDFSNSIVKAIAAAGGNYWGPWIKDVTAESVNEAHACDLLVDLWGVDSTEGAIAYAKSLNGDAITTGNPTLV